MMIIDDGVPVGVAALATFGRLELHRKSPTMYNHCESESTLVLCFLRLIVNNAMGT